MEFPFDVFALAFVQGESEFVVSLVLARGDDTAWKAADERRVLTTGGILRYAHWDDNRHRKA
jgi:hypothetical protein